MKIARLTICDWNDRRSIDTVIENPCWTDIEAAIRALNNRNLNDIYLHLDDSPETWLAVGGGDGQYLVTGSINAESFPTLIDASKSEEPRIYLMVGGQLCDYPCSYVVDLDRALQATRSVVETGTFDEEIGWTYI